MVWLFALGTAEVVLRLVWIRPPDKMTLLDWAPMPLHRFDDRLGFRPNPNVTMVHSLYRGHRATIRTNSRGFRDREHDLAKQPGVPRVVVLGDSFTFGFGVNNGETFCDYLGALLPGVEFINLGVTAWNVTQERKLLELEGLSYSPDLVLLAFVQNDIGPGGIPSRAALTYRPPAPRIKRFLASHSYLYDLVRTWLLTHRGVHEILVRLELRRPLGGYESLDTNLRPSLKNYPPGLAREWDLTMNELLAIQHVCSAHGVKFLVASVPARQALSPEALEASLAWVRYTPGDFDLAKPYRELGEFCRRHNIPYVNGYEGLRRWGGRIYTPYDLHFNAQGHREFANLLAGPVQRILSIEQRAAASR